MATAAERKALLFLAAVACLGVGARIARGRGDAALVAAGGAPPGDHSAIDAQLGAVDGARGAARAAGASRTRAKGSAPPRAHRRRAAADSLSPDSSALAAADSLASSPPARGSRRSRRPVRDSAPPPVDGWAQRTVVTTLAPGGLGVVRGGTPAPEPDSEPTPRRVRRRRKP